MLPSFCKCKKPLAYTHMCAQKPLIYLTFIKAHASVIFSCCNIHYYRDRVMAFSSCLPNEIKPFPCVCILCFCMSVCVCVFDCVCCVIHICVYIKNARVHFSKLTLLQLQTEEMKLNPRLQTYSLRERQEQRVKSE